MPPRNLERDFSAQKTFKKKKVLVVEELARLLASSIGTARRRLKEWGTYTSYNCNGRFYVLNNVAEFDSHGLWRHRSVLFSQYGNLKKTVIHIIRSSAAGLTGSEIGNLVRLEPRSFLSHFRNEPQLHRERIKGRFIYFSSDRAIYTKQKQRLLDQITRESLIRFPTDAEAVVILVERIKHPHLSIEALCRKLRERKCRFSTEELSNFLGHHGLQKKTQDTYR